VATVVPLALHALRRDVEQTVAAVKQVDVLDVWMHGAQRAAERRRLRSVVDAG
jgi:hypothetical protein